MPDIDKWQQFVLWIGAIGVGAGSMVAGFLGFRSKTPAASDDRRRDEEMRRLEIKVGDDELRRDIERVIEASRVSQAGELDALRERLREIELHQNARLMTEMAALQQHRPSSQ